jgi:para-nitrobenzyl esterase
MIAHSRATAEAQSQIVTLDNFTRAETDMYFGAFVKAGGIGKLVHSRSLADIDHQTVVRMNRDTIYSNGVFDLDAGPVTLSLPDTGRRFMSMQIVNQDHYSLDVVYGPGAFTYGKDKVGTRYVAFIIRTLANPEDASDMKAANEAQDKISFQQAARGKWEAPNWDEESQDKVRAALKTLSTCGYSGARFGTEEEVHPIAHLIGAAIGWGGNPDYAAVYQGETPRANDDGTVHRLTVKGVPVDGFWSISVYNENGFFEKNALNKYSLNSLTAKPDADGATTIQFGGCTEKSNNCLPVPKGWNYTVRLYRPRKEILDGTWKFPEAKPL